MYYIYIILLHIFNDFLFFSCIVHLYTTTYDPRMCFSIILCNILLDKLITSLITRCLLLRSGIESNPGPTRKLNYGFWNLDSLLTRDGHKLSVIEGLNSNHKFDLFGVVETYLNKDILDSKLKIQGFSPEPFRADSPSTARPQGGVCLYFNENLPIKNRSDLIDLEETILAEIKLEGKKIFVLLSYRSPSQSSTSLDNYCDKIQKILDKINKEKPHLIVLSGDFNARSPIFWEFEKCETSPGKKLSNFMVLNALDQVINEPTHFPRDDVETCIDLVMTNKPQFIVHSGVIPSPDPRCKHQIVNVLINFSVPCPPPYKRTIWKYKAADQEKIKQEFRNINWSELFMDKSADDIVSVFNSKFLDIMKQHIPHNLVTINERDAPWITPQVKTAIKRNHRTYNNWVARGKPSEGKANVKKIQKETDVVISEAKVNYHNSIEEKLCASSSGCNLFWSVINRMIDKKKNCNIPPLLENNVFISCFKEKARIFNEYFASQCSPLDNGSTLPFFHKKTMASLSHIDVDPKLIVTIIKNLSTNKAHGYDEISVHMLKLVIDEISIPLKMIFDRCIAEGKFPSAWKKANVQPVHKKNSRQDKTNYRPISLLPIISKIFEKVLFDSIYSYLHSNKLLSKNQSGFRPGDSTINQLLAITHDIFTSFEQRCETRAIFLDISKAFDKVWHEGLVFKMASNGIEGNILDLLKSFLSNRYQRVVLNGTSSNWLPLYSGVPQGSVLGPLLFLIYINDLSDNISCNMKLFADDASIFVKVLDVGMSNQLIKADLDKVTQWAFQWKMKFNPDITKQAIEVIFSHKRKPPVHPALVFNNIPVKRELDTKHLGLILDNKLDFRKHIAEKIKTANKGIGLLKFLTRFLTREKLSLIYKMHVRPHLDCGDVIYHNQSQESMDLLESIQYQAGLIITGCWKGTSREKVYAELGWESLSDRRHFRRLSLYYKIKNNMTPNYLAALAQPFDQNHTTRFQNSFFPYCHTNWINLDLSIRNAASLNIFKKQILSDIRPPMKSTYGVRDRRGIRIISQLRVQHSDLRNDRFRHKFNCPSPDCPCGSDVESNTHYLLHCSRYHHQRINYLQQVRDIVPDFDTLSDEELCNMMLFGQKSGKYEDNASILRATAAFIHKTKRFAKLEAFSD